MAWQGVAWQGKVKFGGFLLKIRHHFVAGRGGAWQGKARHGKAWQGKARLILKSQ